MHLRLRVSGVQPGKASVLGAGEGLRTARSHVESLLSIGCGGGGPLSRVEVCARLDELARVGADHVLAAGGELIHGEAFA